MTKFNKKALPLSFNRKDKGTRKVASDSSKEIKEDSSGVIDIPTSDDVKESMEEDDEEEDKEIKEDSSGVIDILTSDDEKESVEEDDEEEDEEIEEDSSGVIDISTSDDENESVEEEHEEEDDGSDVNEVANSCGKLLHHEEDEEYDDDESTSTKENMMTPYANVYMSSDETRSIMHHLEYILHTVRHISPIAVKKTQLTFEREITKWKAMNKMHERIADKLGNIAEAYGKLFQIPNKKNVYMTKPGARSVPNDPKDFLESMLSAFRQGLPRAFPKKVLVKGSTFFSETKQKRVCTKEFREYILRETKMTLGLQSVQVVSDSNNGYAIVYKL